MKVSYANGDVFSASDVNDITGTINLAGGAQWAAGKNKIINGSMVIDQRNNGSAIASLGSGTTYTVDRFYYYGSAAAKFSFQRNQGSVTPPTGFANYAGFTSLSAYTVSATDQLVYRQVIEGSNIASFAFGTASATTITLSFWVRSSLTGTFGGSVANSDQNRSYPFSYTISAANTWERKSVTITGDTTGTWSTTSTGGMNITFSLATGSTYSGTAGAWSATSYLTSVTGAVSVAATNGATWYVTGVQVEQGSTMTAFQTATGTIQGELAACQRYYQRFGGETAYQTLGSSYNVSTTKTNAIIALPVPMRVIPTSLDSSTLCIQDSNDSISGTLTSVAFANAGNQTIRITGNSTGMTDNLPGALLTSNSTSGYIGFSAEL
jgi:hypothetical protein